MNRQPLETLSPPWYYGVPLELERNLHEMVSSTITDDPVYKFILGNIPHASEVSAIATYLIEVRSALKWPLLIDFDSGEIRSFLLQTPNAPEDRALTISFDNKLLRTLSSASYHRLTYVVRNSWLHMPKCCGSIVELIATRPSLRRRGYASSLLARLTLAADLGVKPENVIAEVSGAPGLALFKAHSFVETKLYHLPDSLPIRVLTRMRT